MGYHITDIKKGVLGKLSKIQEELDECKDAELQNNKIMLLVELSDLIGAVDLYLKANFKGINLQDILTMTEATQRAFKSGDRK